MWCGPGETVGKGEGCRSDVVWSRREEIKKMEKSVIVQNRA